MRLSFHGTQNYSALSCLQRKKEFRAREKLAEKVATGILEKFHSKQHPRLPPPRLLGTTLAHVCSSRLPAQSLEPSQLYMGIQHRDITQQVVASASHAAGHWKREAEQLTPREPLLKEKAALYMQSLICHVQKCFTTPREAAAEKQRQLAAVPTSSL